MTEIDKHQRILNHYGIDKQLEKLAEECLELVAVIRKERIELNKSRFLRRLSDEIADVEVVTEQIKLHYGAHNVIDRIKDHKVERTLFEIETEESREF